MKMKTSALVLLVAVFFMHGLANAQQEFEPTAASNREAVARGQVREFLNAMETMAVEAEAKRDWEKASMAYTEASSAAITIGQLQKALSHANKAVEMAERAKDPWLQTNATLQMALAYMSLGQGEKEREWLQKGLEVVKKVGQRGEGERGGRETQEALLYSQLGQNFLRQGKAQQAVEYISYSLQALDSRLSFLQRVRRYNPQISRVIQITETLMVSRLSQLGTAYLRAGNPQEAIKALERGMAILKASGVKARLEGLLYSGVGRAYLAQKDFPRALESLTKALQIGEERRQTSLIQSASSAIGDVFLQTHREAEAIPYYKRAIEGIESTRSLLESEELRTSFFEDKGRTYGGIILAHLGASNVEEAFNYNERARSRAFLDILGSKVQLARSGTILEHERALQARISVLRAMMAGEESDAPERQQLGQELEDAQKAYDDFLVKVRKENREQASLMNVEPLTLKQVQELLDPGVTVLEYFVVPQAVLLWVVEKDRLRFVNIPLSRKELVNKAAFLRDSIYQIEEKEKFKALSQELYKHLIEPALPHIRGKELLVIPHDVLHYLPYQALLSPQGKYLIQDYPVYYLSSSSLMQFTKEKRTAKGDLSAVLAQAGKVLAFGNPDLGDPSKNLRFAELEAGEVQKLYSQSTVLLRKQATEEKAKALSPPNDILHFATHAELSEEDPLSSAILLAKEDKEDGRLEVREIFGMDLNANLVVLSACETGLGKLSSGDEMVGLTRAFVYAGTPSVVASLWNVEDSSTAALMASFYKNLRTMSKVEALRQAQLELIRGRATSDLLARRGVGGIGKLGEVPEAKSDSPGSVSVSVSTSHPYFWAPFILVGDGK